MSPARALSCSRREPEQSCQACHIARAAQLQRGQCAAAHQDGVPVDSANKRQRVCEELAPRRLLAQCARVAYLKHDAPGSCCAHTLHLQSGRWGKVSTDSSLLLQLLPHSLEWQAPRQVEADDIDGERGARAAESWLRGGRDGKQVVAVRHLCSARQSGAVGGVVQVHSESRKVLQHSRAARGWADGCSGQASLP